MGRPKGIPQSPEWKKAQSERAKKYWADKKNRAAQSEKLKESWADPELRKKQSEMVKVKHAADPKKWAKSEETKKKISKSLTGKPHPHTPEQNAKIAAANRGKKRSAETCKKISEAKRGQKYRARTPEHTANQSKVQKGKSKKCGPAVSAFRKAYDKTPEGRKRLDNHSKAMKQWHKDHPDASAAMIEAAHAANPKWCDTKPELLMVDVFNEIGVEFVKQFKAKDLPAEHRHHKWDFRVVGEKILCEIDGCFWHGCEKHTTAERRAELKESMDKQVARDAATTTAGWTIVRFWEHELDASLFGVAMVIEDELAIVQEAHMSA